MGGADQTERRIDGLVARFAQSEWFMAESSARTLIRPHGEEARVRDATAVVQLFWARAVSNHEGGPCLPTHPSRRIAQSASTDCAMLLRMRLGTGSRCGAYVKAAIAFTLAEAAH